MSCLFRNITLTPKLRIACLAVGGTLALGSMGLLYAYREPIAAHCDHGLVRLGHMVGDSPPRTKFYALELEVEHARTAMLGNVGFTILGIFGTLGTSYSLRHAVPFLHQH